jgi:hypothetical protein
MPQDAPASVHPESAGMAPYPSSLLTMRGFGPNVMCEYVQLYVPAAND